MCKLHCTSVYTFRIIELFFQLVDHSAYFFALECILTPYISLISKKFANSTKHITQKSYVKVSLIHFCKQKRFHWKHPINAWFKCGDSIRKIPPERHTRCFLIYKIRTRERFCNRTPPFFLFKSDQFRFSLWQCQLPGVSWPE